MLAAGCILMVAGLAAGTTVPTAIGIFMCVTALLVDGDIF